MRRTARTTAYLQADQAVVAAVIGDVERWDDWLRGVTSARLLAREQSVAMIEIEAPSWSERGLLFELATGSGDRRFELRQIGRDGGLSLVARVTKSAGGAGSEVAAEARLDTSWLGRDRIGRRALARALEAALHALDVRAQQVAAGTVSPERPKKRRILEVRRAGGGLEVWYRGETFQLGRHGGDGENRATARGAAPDDAGGGAGR
jgi:hypothetical protein